MHPNGCHVLISPITPTTCHFPGVYLSREDPANHDNMPKRPQDADDETSTTPQANHAVPSKPNKKHKTRKEGKLPSDDENSGVTSDETWSPSSSDADIATEKESPPPPPPIRQLRSRGPVVRPGDEMHAIMDKIDEVVDNESDFSSTTESEDEDDDESSENEDEEEDEESDTEEDGYSDDDSFVTSGDEEEDDDDEEEEVTVPVQDPNIDASDIPILDPITTDELLANFPDAPPEP